MADHQAPASPGYAIFASSTVDEHDDDEISINLKIKSIVPFKVRKSDKIKKLKQLCSKEGVSENLLDFCHRDESLNVEHTFADYNIRENSTVKLVLDTLSVLARRLFIKIPSNPHLNMMIVANVNDTAYSVKLMIASKVGCNPHNYDLMYKSRLLPPHVTLASRNIDTHSTLYLIEIPQDLVWISVYTPTNGMISLQIKKLQTVGYARAVVGSMINSRVDDAGLLLAGKALDDSRTLASYSIEDHTVLQLIYPFQVSVKLYKARTITLNVLSSDDVNVINRRVYGKLGLAPPSSHPISFEGRKLVTGYSIASYGVKKDSLLRMGRPSARSHLAG